MSTPFTQSKAKEILKEKSPTLHGKPITKKQHGLLGFIAGGGKPTKLGKRKKVRTSDGYTYK